MKHRFLTRKTNNNNNKILIPFCISPRVLSKPNSSQQLAPCRRWLQIIFAYSHWQAVQTQKPEYLTFLPNRNNIHHMKTMLSFAIPQALLPAGNGVEGINVLLKLMYDDKDVAVFAADPEGCKLREIPPLQHSSHSEQALPCLRQLHFYDHNQDFFPCVFHTCVYCPQEITSVTPSCKKWLFHSPLPTWHFMEIMIGSMFSQDRWTLLHSVQEDCGTRAPTEKILKLLNHMLREHAGESVWE